MNWLQLVMALLQITPQILQTITQVEATFGTAPGQGPAKKAIIMNTVSPAPQEIQDHVSKLIDTTVAALNTNGIFKK